VRDVAKADARAIATEVVDACAHFLVRRKFEVVNVGRFAENRPFLNRAAAVAETLRALLEVQPTGVRRYWTLEDRDDLLPRLKKLIEAAQTCDQRLLRQKRGRRPDVQRHALEDTIALVLLRNGVTPTKAKTGTFALVLEQVHSAVGISERDVHKSVRRAHDALMRAKQAS
jgi:hypothetical protein